jgi:charged multivesicular body protein 6
MGNTSSSHKISAQDRFNAPHHFLLNPLTDRQSRAILDMKNQRDKLHQYQHRITAITSRETAIARECLARGEKSKALLALRRKKYQETLLAKTDAQLETLEQLTSNVEFALVQKDVVFGLQQGTKVLKQIHAEMGGIENVEKMMGESEDARAYQRQISEMLGGQMSNQDEDEVEDELEALEKEVRGVGEVDETPAIAYPAPPESEPHKPPIQNSASELKARAKARAREAGSAQATEPILA